MPEITWRGSDRAFQAHLQQAEMNARSWDFLRRTEVPGFEGHAWEDMPQHLQQIYMLATSYGNIAAAIGLTELIEGETVTTVRSHPDEVYSQATSFKAGLFMDIERDIVTKGTTFYVSDRMVNVITDIAERLEPEPLFGTDLQTPHGFMMFERPILMDDLHPDTGVPLAGLLMPIRGIGWSRRMISKVTSADGEVELSEGVTLVLYTDEDSYTEYYMGTLKELLPHKYEEYLQLHLPSNVLWMSDVLPWAFKTSWRRTDDGLKAELLPDEDGAIRVADNVAWMRRWFLAFCRLCWQEIIVSDLELANRGLRRRWKRLIPYDEQPLPSHIRVLKLRRVHHEHDDDTYTEGEPGARRWRTPVRGHPRRQHYPSLGPAYIDGVWNPSSHRLIWIEDHYRGEGPVWESHPITEVTR